MSPHGADHLLQITLIGWCETFVVRSLASETHQVSYGVGQVRLWHLADVQSALMNVRFEGNNGHDADVTRCLLLTLSGLSKAAA